MPELPEVETFRRYFANHALNQRIARVEVRDERILGEIRKETFAKKLRGREFKSARRHGKHLFADARMSSRAKSRDLAAGLDGRATRSTRSLDDARDDTTWLHLHFGMTGDLAYYTDRANEPRFAKIVFAFDGGAYLAFEDVRLFGLAELVDSPDDYIAAKGLGADPLDPSFTFARFAALLERRKGAMKSLLMSQEILAGIGNLYADETLFQTGIHPRRAIDKLKDAEKRAVYTTMRRILRDVIAAREKGKAWPSRYLSQHREEGDRCPNCGGTIRRTVVFGRTTYFCGKHQK